MNKNKFGRLPQMANGEAFINLQAKPSSELASIRADIGSLMHVHGVMVNRLRIEAEAITSILHEREKPELEVSDHAVVRWLEKVKDIDITAIRNEISDAALAAKAAGASQICRAKGDAIAYTKDDVTFIVAYRNNIVTIIVGDYKNPVT